MYHKSMGFFTSCFIQSQFKRNVVTYSIDVCVATYHVRQTNETTQKTCKELRCYRHHRNYPALEKLQRKDLTTHKVLKLLNKSGSQCKYTAEYRFKIPK